MFPAPKIQIIRVFKYLTPRNSSANDMMRCFRRFHSRLPRLDLSITMMKKAQEFNPDLLKIEYPVGGR